MVCGSPLLDFIILLPQSHFGGLSDDDFVGHRYTWHHHQYIVCVISIICGSLSFVPHGFLFRQDVAERIVHPTRNVITSACSRLCSIMRMTVIGGFYFN